MLKKLIILLNVLAIENSINCAEAQNAVGINYITQATDEDLAQIQPADICGICQDLLGDRRNLYKSNCEQMITHPHIFHRDCILGSINSGADNALNCPLCRGQMVDLNAPNAFDLIDASANGNLETVRLLLDRGADINTRNNHGNTALTFASYNGHLEMARLLLGRGADINARNNLGSTALMIANRYRHLEMAKLLLDRGADINTRNNDGDTPLMLARQNGHLEIADLLIARGAIE